MSPSRDEYMPKKPKKKKVIATFRIPEVRMHIHTDARTRQMYVHMSYARAVGVSRTVIKGDGNSRAVGSKRRDRENVICRRPVRPKTCQKKKSSQRFVYLSYAYQDQDPNSAHMHWPWHHRERHSTTHRAYSPSSPMSLQ